MSLIKEKIKRICYHCHEEGHCKNRYLKLAKEGQSGHTNATKVVPVSSRPPLRDQEKTTFEVTTIIFENTIRALFNSAASHSFIARDVVKSLSLKSQVVTNPTVMSNHLEGSTYLSLIGKDLVVDMQR